MALKISNRERNLLFAFAALVLSYLLYSQIYVPLDSRLSTIRAEIEIAERKAQSMRQTAQNLAAIERKVNDLHGRLDIIWRSVGREPDLPWLVRSLEAYSEEAGAELLNLRPLPIVAGKYVAEMPFELTLQGSFDSILAFLRQAEEGHPAVAFTGIKADVLETANDLSSPKLDVVVSGKTYFRTEH